MNEELQKQIAAILKKALDAAQHGGQWLAGQMPDVLHQLLAWTVITGAMAALGAVAVFAAWLWACKRARKEDEFLWAMAVIFGVLIAGLPFSLCADAALDGLKALVAPKLFLLEYAAHLAK